MLEAHDDDGNVIATLDTLVARDETGKAIGLVDFAAHEQAGAELTDVWMVDGAKGSRVRPDPPVERESLAASRANRTRPALPRTAP